MARSSIRKALSQLTMLVFACLLAFLVAGFGKSGTTTFAYPPPPTDVAPFIPLDEPYPAPESSLLPQDSSSGDSAYPPPESGQTNSGILPTLVPIPKDRVVAVYSDGHFVDFNQVATQYSDIVSIIENSMFVPPTYPENSSSPSPLRIIGDENRFQIQDTKVFPWTTVVKIEGQWDANNSFTCTGWMLGPSTVVTAGHCVYNFIGTKTFAYNVTITPALNTDDANSMPFGSCRTLNESVLTPWFDNGDGGYDYGVYKLACRIGQRTGNLGFKIVSGEGVGTTTALTGYPGDKGGTTMWASLGSITSSTPTLFFYDNDMMPGQSGGPVWDYSDPNCHVCGVAVNAQEYDPPAMNSGPRINETAFNYFLTEQQFVAHMIFLPLVVRDY
jgi:glutamyl endopeptidase